MLVIFFFFTAIGMLFLINRPPSFFTVFLKKFSKTYTYKKEQHNAQMILELKS